MCVKALFRLLITFCFVIVTAPTLCCCGGTTKMTINHQESKNPFDSHSAFAAEPLFFGKTKVKILTKSAQIAPFDSDEYRYTMTPEELDEMNREYLKALTKLAQAKDFTILPTPEAGDAPFAIHNIVEEVNVPRYNPTAKIHVFFATRDGDPIDEVELEAIWLSSPVPFMEQEPFTLALGRAQAKSTVKYLVDRIGAKRKPAPRIPHAMKTQH